VLSNGAAEKERISQILRGLEHLRDQIELPRPEDFHGGGLGQADVIERGKPKRGSIAASVFKPLLIGVANSTPGYSSSNNNNNNINNLNFDPSVDTDGRTDANTSLANGSSVPANVGSGSDSLELLFLDAFFQNTNHFLFLFSESRLRQHFGSTESVDNQGLLIETYLVLALGAKYSVYQAGELQNEWYMKARQRLLADEFDDDLHMMRILTLICVFEIDDHPDVAWYFLDLALSIGHLCGLDTEVYPLKYMDQANRSEWLRVWESMSVLTLCLFLKAQSPSHALFETPYLMDLEVC